MKQIMAAVFLIYSVSAFADSPLTSTQFYTAYSEIKIIAEAAKGGRLTAAHMEYLSGTGPVDVKVALINRLGWDIKGKNNFDLYFNFLSKKYRVRSMEELFSKADGDELICLSYIRAMDNYFNVNESLLIAEAAVKKKPSSLTINMIHALVKAQIEMDRDWCAVYNVVNRVKNDSSLNQDMKPEAVGIIYKYIVLYRDECTK